MPLIRLGWLRAAVLGANDGILSTSSLIIGVASAQAAIELYWSQGSRGWSRARCRCRQGNMYRSVRNRIPTAADIAREGKELRDNRAGETRELATSTSSVAWTRRSP